MPKKGDNPAKIQGAAQQFEALMVGQMMRTMRESGAGWMGTGEDQSGEVAMDYAEQQFAQALSKQGGLGLSKLIAAGLSRRDAVEVPVEAGGPGSATTGKGAAVPVLAGAAKTGH
jgi:flagellar protein FlgJ